MNPLVPVPFHQAREALLVRPQMATSALVPTWTGVEVRLLRAAKRMSVREFAAYVGVSARMVGRWEAGGADVVPRAFNQQSLDICLDRCAVEERGRFVLQMHGSMSVGPGGRCVVIVQRCLQRSDMRRALADRDIASVFRILNTHGMSQREIAAMTGQSQSEISEILAGRRVIAYDVLARVSDGLGIPRGYMGLAYDASTRTLIQGGRPRPASPAPAV
jgi:transcriptional regulator with XRE-family HTH domain